MASITPCILQKGRNSAFFVKPILERRISSGGADCCVFRPVVHFHVFEKTVIMMAEGQTVIRYLPHRLLPEHIEFWAPYR